MLLYAYIYIYIKSLKNRTRGSGVYPLFALYRVKSQLPRRNIIILNCRGFRRPSSRNEGL